MWGIYAWFSCFFSWHFLQAKIWEKKYFQEILRLKKHYKKTSEYSPHSMVVCCCHPLLTEWSLWVGKNVQNLLKVNNKGIRTTSMTSFWYLLCELRTNLTCFSNTFILIFGYVFCMLVPNSRIAFKNWALVDTLFHFSKLTNYQIHKLQKHKFFHLMMFFIHCFGQ